MEGPAEEGGSTPCCLHVDVCMYVCMYVCMCLPDAKNCCSITSSVTRDGCVSTVRKDVSLWGGGEGGGVWYGMVW